ncbi:sulfur reduction protein DsrE [Phycicoccus sp. Root563]|uniref:DsrE family protein n=1 Tax=Phycicoccus sp. Root563 TaxID=1736562 RepID=UPI000703B4E9|nr:DsrE family protein [Phycicoccus sp. Root563]KQZ90119.1 sulfur reduction protein DsrE [Phycicoccus sp. Root563]
MTASRTRLVVKATSGAPSDPDAAGTESTERLNQALTVAATAAASGVEVSLWLTGDAAWMAVPGRAEQVRLAHAAPLRDLLDAVLATGTVTVCGQCAARRDLTEADLVEGVVVRGAAAFVEEVMADGAQALVY